MTGAERLTPADTARQAVRAGLPLAVDRLEVVTATANHVQGVVEVLRGIDLGDTPPAQLVHAPLDIHREP